MSLHDDAVAALTGWRAPDLPQERLRARFVEHLREHDDGEQRSCFPAHLTAGTIVLDASLEHVLLNLHRKARRWFHFGGHLEPGDRTLAGAALREAHEESGIARLQLDDAPLRLDEHAVEFCDPRGTVQHLDVRYAALAPGGVDPVTSEESLDVRWWPVADLPDLEDEMHRLIAAARERWSGDATQPSTQPSTSEASTSSGSVSEGGGSSRAAADQPSR